MRYEPRTKIKVSNHLRGLSPILNTWTSLLDDYCRSSAYEDNPWFYNERATLSTLAGAAWRLNGWTALEEYATSKWGGRPKAGGVESGNVRAGRCDLHLAHRSKAFAIEAKQAWQPIGRPSDPVGRMGVAIRAAKRDARKLTIDEADWRLAAVFTAPFLPATHVRDENGKVSSARVSAKIDQWLLRVNERRHDAIAYYFTPRCLAMVSADGKRLFPGVVLTLDICKRATRSNS